MFLYYGGYKRVNYKLMNT